LLANGRPHREVSFIIAHFALLLLLTVFFPISTHTSTHNQPPQFMTYALTLPSYHSYHSQEAAAGPRKDSPRSKSSATTGSKQHFASFKTMPRPVVASLLVLAAMTVGQASAQVDSYLSEADVQRFQGIANGTW